MSVMYVCQPRSVQYNSVSGLAQNKEFYFLKVIIYAKVVFHYENESSLVCETE